MFERNFWDDVEPHKATARLDDDEKGRNTIPTPGGNQEMGIINESGLYSLVMTSRKPEAKRFKKWVTSEVLPSIRKTGAYGAAAVNLHDPATLRTLLLASSEREIALIERLREIKAEARSRAQG